MEAWLGAPSPEVLATIICPWQDKRPTNYPLSEDPVQRRKNFQAKCI